MGSRADTGEPPSSHISHTSHTVINLRLLDLAAWCGFELRLTGISSPQSQQPDLLGTTENELGLRKWLEDQGHTLVTTSDKDTEDSVFDKELEDAEIIITTPYVKYP